MDNIKNTTEAFKNYAESELKNHQEELNTRYENESPDAGELKKAYQVHREIYAKELDQKIQELSKNDEGQAKADLDKLKSQYVEKLKLKEASS